MVGPGISGKVVVDRVVRVVRRPIECPNALIAGGGVQ